MATAAIHRLEDARLRIAAATVGARDRAVKLTATSLQRVAATRGRHLLEARMQRGDLKPR